MDDLTWKDIGSSYANVYLTPDGRQVQGRFHQGGMLSLRKHKKQRDGWIVLYRLRIKQWKPVYYD